MLRASAAWPADGISAEQFIAHVARVLPNAADVLAASESFRAEDFLLVVQALAGGKRAQAQIIKTHLSRVADFVAKLDRSPAFADDVRQELAMLLFTPQGVGHEGAARESKLLGYSGKGPLAAFLRTVAVRTAQNMRRGKRALLSDEGQVDAVDTLSRSPERKAVDVDQAHAFGERLREAILHLTDHDRALLKAHYLDGLTLEQVAAQFGISRATAARHLAHARSQVLAYSKARRMANAGPVTRASGNYDEEIPSQLAFTLSKVFRDGT